MSEPHVAHTKPLNRTQKLTESRGRLALVGRDKTRAPLKTPAWEANRIRKECFCSSEKWGNLATNAQKNYPRSSTFYPRPSTLDPRQYTPDHRQYTLDPRPSTKTYTRPGNYVEVSSQTVKRRRNFHLLCFETISKIGSTLSYFYFQS